MNRLVEPEILDSLAYDDPRAIRNRSELRTLNRIMGNFRWFSNQLARHAGPSRRNILELGAGDGSMGMQLLKSRTVDVSCSYCGVDLIPKPACWPVNWQWWQQDLMQTHLDTHHRVLLANLILHHFEESDLLRLGSRIEASSVERIFICEPLRRKVHLWQIHLIRFLGMSAIALHDARVSIRAGFRKLEVCAKLGLDPEKWDFHSSETFLGANRVTCWRK